MHITVLVHINDVVVSAWKYTVCSQHVTNYYMTVVPNALCILQVLVHDSTRCQYMMIYTRCTLHVAGLVHIRYTICTIACYRYFMLLLIRDCRQETFQLYYLFLVTLFSQTSRVSARICFFSILLSYLQFEVSFLVHVSHEVVFCTICRPLQLSDRRCSFDLGPETQNHISVDMVIIRIYNCQTRTQLLIIVRYNKIRSFSGFSCNQN